MVAPERDSQAVQVEKLLELAEKIQADIDSLERVRSQRSARVSVLIGGLAGVLYFLIRYSFSSNLASRDHIEISSLTAALAITVALAVQNLGKLVLRSGGRRPQIPLFRSRLDNRIEREYRALQAALETIREIDFTATFPPIERAEIRIRLSRFSVDERLGRD